MTVGLPGTGIGGLFYIVLAFMMPVREACMLIVGKGRSLKRWLAIGVQTANAAGIVAGLWGIGWLIGVAVQYTRLLSSGPAGGPTGGGRLLQAAEHATNIVSTAGAYLAAVTLVGVVLAVEIASLLVRRRAPGGWGVRTNAPPAR